MASIKMLVNRVFGGNTDNIMDVFITTVNALESMRGLLAEEKKANASKVTAVKDATDRKMAKIEKKSDDKLCELRYKAANITAELAKTEKYLSNVKKLVEIK